jgi:hypothetical protein
MDMTKVHIYTVGAHHASTAGLINSTISFIGIYELVVTVYLP